jgi:hypothetical protein
MERLPDSLSIALWLVGSLWIVGVIAWLRDAPGELVVAALAAGLIAGCLELGAENRRVGR